MIGIDSFGNQFEDISDDYFTINANDSVIDLSDSLLSMILLWFNYRYRLPSIRDNTS